MNPISIFESISITVILIMDQFIKKTQKGQITKRVVYIYMRE